jgi:hypothetical protein
MDFRQLHVIEKTQPIAPKDEIKSGAHYQGLRGRKGIYKNIMGSDSALDEYYIQVRATYKIQFGFVAPLGYINTL